MSDSTLKRGVLLLQHYHFYANTYTIIRENNEIMAYFHTDINGYATPTDKT